MFTREDIDALLSNPHQPAVSIFLPTHRAGREIRQDPIRLKNLIGKAEERLAAMGLRRPDAQEILNPATSLVDDEDFWRHQDEGLAIFVAPGTSHIFKVPSTLREDVVIGQHFHVKPLLPLLMEDGTFYLLTISASRAHLYRASRFDITEVKDIDLPQGVAEIAAETEYQNTLHSSPVARPRSNGPGGIPKTHNFGETPEEQRKTQLIEYLHRVAKPLESYFSGKHDPIVFAAQPEVEGHFRSLAKLSGLVETSFHINPDGEPLDGLHQQAFEIVRPRFTNGWQGQFERFQSLAGDGSEKVTTKVEEIVKAARYGRVDVLFVTNEEHLWGRFDEAADAVVAHGHAVGDDDDLIDYAAAQTLMQGGQVAVLSRDDLPPGGMMAAILRY